MSTTAPFSEAAINFLSAKEFGLNDLQIATLKTLVETGKIIIKDTTKEDSRFLKFDIDGLKGFSLSFSLNNEVQKFTIGKTDVQVFRNQVGFNCDFCFTETTLKFIMNLKGLNIQFTSGMISYITEGRRVTNEQKVMDFCKIASFWVKPGPKHTSKTVNSQKQPDSK